MPQMLRRMPAPAGLAITAIIVLWSGAAMASAAPARGKVVAVDKRSGHIAWEAPLWSRADAAVPPLVTPELVYVLEDGKTLKALDAATGRQRWQAAVISRLPLTRVDNLIVAVAGDTAIAFNQRNGKQVWSFSPRLYPEWKFDSNTIPVAAPGRLLLPAGDTLIALDSATGQPAWAYTVTAAKVPLKPVVADGMVYVRSGREEAPVSLKLEDGLPNSGEYALPPDMARARAQAREAEQNRSALARRASVRGKSSFIAVRAAVAHGGKALAATGARSWRFTAPRGWTIDRIVGESAGQLYALLGETDLPVAAEKSASR